MKKALTSIAVSAAPLAIGGSIYILWRSPSLLMFRWFKVAGLQPAIDRARTLTACLRPELPSWLLYSLPDATWACCGILLFAAIWRDSGHSVRHFWILLAPCLALGGEFAQYLRLIPGTFDVADVITCTVASAMALGLANRLFGYGIGSHQAQSV